MLDALRTKVHVEPAFDGLSVYRKLSRGTGRSPVGTESRMTVYLLPKRAGKIPFSLLQYSISQAGRNRLCGRDILQPADLLQNEWKKIMWTACDLKKLILQTEKQSLSLLCNKHVTIMPAKTSGLNLLSSSLGCQLLGARSTLYADPDFHSEPNYFDSGRALSQITDLFLVHGCNQAILYKTAEGSSAPVIALSTNMFCIIKGLALLITILEHYKSLKRLKLAWIGPPNPLCNTIFSIFPLFGINIKFCCICLHGTGLMSPMALETALKAGKQGFAEIHQCSTAAEACYRSHIIVVSSHQQIEHQITHQMVEEAELDWILFHSLPRTEVEVEDSLFQSKNNKTWLSSANHLYIAMALMVSTLSHYQPQIPMPSFDGP